MLETAITIEAPITNQMNGGWGGDDVASMTLTTMNTPIIAVPATSMRVRPCCVWE